METKKKIFIITLILNLIYPIMAGSTQINFLCSDYCGGNGNSCTSITNSGCGGTCNNNFTTSGSDCVIDTSQYTIIFEQIVSGTSTFSNTTTTICGSYIISGIYTTGVSNVIYAGPISQNYYSMRLLAFVIWIDTAWSWGDNINLNVNGASKANAGYPNNFCFTTCYYISNQCGGTQNQTTSTLDSNDFSYSSSNVNITISQSSSASPAKLWGFNQAIVLIRLCNAACQSCTGSSISNCQSCTIYNSIQYLLSGSTCYITCPAKTYQNSTTTCDNCDNSCASCNGSSNTDCITCASPKYFYSGNNTCSNTCPNGYYPDSTNPICDACDPTCTTCTGNPSPCSACNVTSGYYLYGSVCVNPCPTSTYISSGKCLNCTSSCTSCSNTSTNCSACASGFVYLPFNNTCPVNCPSNYYNDSGTCLICPTTCATCSGNPTPCLSCNTGNYLYNNVCNSSCPVGYYSNSTSLTCITCDITCSACSAKPTNCSACAIGFLYLPLNNTCPSACPSNYFINGTTCYICQSNCATCTGNPTPCLSCINGYYLYNNSCLSSCPTGTYAATTICSNCDSSCSSCSGSSTNCSGCTTSYVLVGYNNTCMSSCPSSFYYVTSNNTCYACSSNCSTCTGYPTPCTICNPGFFLFMGIYCGTTCPNPYFMNSSTNNCDICSTSCTACSVSSTNCSSCTTGYYLNSNSCETTCPSGTVTDYNNLVCINCQITTCVQLNISIYLVNSTTVYIDMNFTQNLTFSTFPYKSFQYITFQDSYVTLNMFQITYTVNSNSSYRIILVPKGQAMIYNEPITVTTIARNTSYYSTNGYIFSDQNFNLSASVNWTYVNMNNVSSIQSNIINTFVSTSNIVNSSPMIQQLKQFGFIFLALNSFQITSCLILINTQLPQNMYQGIRFIASFIFYDVPSYQQQSTKIKMIITTPITNIVNNRRILNINEFMFRRTDFTSYFLFDTYSMLFTIVLIYLILWISLKYSPKYQFLQKNRSFLYSALHKFHQIAIMYITLTIFFQFQYFDPINAIRWISMILCLVVNIYFVAYHAYKYYDLTKYPYLQMDTKQYLEIINKYGSMLKNLRFQEYDKNVRLRYIQYWIRPYNYHIISYVKKFLMMFAFTLFYNIGRNQIYVLIIQLLQIIRFCCTWPFKKKWHNIYRLGLQLTLLTVFFITLGIDVTVTQIQYSATNNFNTLVNTYYQLGWAGLSFVIVFNVGFLIWYIIEFKNMIYFSNKQMIQQNRKEFYKQKYEKYEVLQTTKNHDYIKVNRMIEKGIIEPLKFSDLPAIDICIQTYQIWKIGNDFEVLAKKLCVLKMNKYPLYSKDNNNIKTENLIQKNLTIDKYSSFHCSISEILNIVRIKNYNSLIIKTFLKVNQNQYKSEQKIIFRMQDMTNQIYLVQNQRIKVMPCYKGRLLKGFPINQSQLLEIKQSQNPKY